MTVLIGCACLLQNGRHFLYVQRLKPNSLQKFSLEPQAPQEAPAPQEGQAPAPQVAPAPLEGQGPLSYSACYREGHIRLLCLCKGGA